MIVDWVIREKIHIRVSFTLEVEYFYRREDISNTVIYVLSAILLNAQVTTY